MFFRPAARPSARPGRAGGGMSATRLAAAGESGPPALPLQGEGWSLAERSITTSRESGPSIPPFGEHST